MPVGGGVGVFVGLGVGVGVGVFVGAGVGVFVGLGVGVCVGPGVGVFVGLGVGVFVGPGVGDALPVGSGLSEGFGSGDVLLPPPPHPAAIAKAAKSTVTEITWRTCMVSLKPRIPEERPDRPTLLVACYTLEPPPEPLGVSA
jgi:hypothetical protein